MKLNHISFFLSFIFFIFLSACGVSKRHYQHVETNLSQKNYKKAEKIIKDSKKVEYGKKNALLYYLNLGWVYHLDNNHRDAQAVLDEADNEIRELFTKKTSDDIASFIGNDNNLPFRGEDFEKIMLSIIRTLDFAVQDKLDSARVEVMKVDNRMNFLNQQRQNKKATYTEDAFAHYLSGLIYESDNEYNDAYISYFKAYKFYKRYQRKYGKEYLRKRYIGGNYDRRSVNAYINQYARSYNIKVPYFIKKALKRLMKKYARSGDLQKLEKELANIEEVTEAEYQKMGQFVFVHYNGYAPKKVPIRFSINPRNHRNLTTSIHMEYPTFKLRYHEVAYAKVSINGQTYTTDIVQPIDRIAVVDLMDRIGGIFAKMVARRVAKYIASQASGAATEDKNVALFANIASNISEQADLRSWRILPAEIGMIPISLPEGTYSAKVTFHSISGRVLETTTINDIKISPNKKIFKTYRTVR